MFKRFSILILSILCLLISNTTLKAEKQFEVDANVTYKVEATGKTLVTHDVTLENLLSTFYATTYTLSLENISAESVKAIDANGKPIQVDLQENGKSLDVKLTFSDAVLGKNAKRHFKISYENSNFAVKTGEVWEISIPRLSDNRSFRDYQINLEIPDSYGQEAYICPAA